jgi:hypothetical protein
MTMKEKTIRWLRRRAFILSMLAFCLLLVPLGFAMEHLGIVNNFVAVAPVYIMIVTVFTLPFLIAFLDTLRD